MVYTYDVKWEPSDVKWASRWDLYLYMGDDQIHWSSSPARPPLLRRRKGYEDTHDEETPRFYAKDKE